jgi:hypothetical protein
LFALVNFNKAHLRAVDAGVSDSLGSRLSLLQKRVRRFAAFVVLGALLHGDFWEQGHPHQPVKIFAGVTYGCERLPVTQEGGGLVHWVRVDLTAPGLELYVTPLDPAAVARGWQYRLRPIEDVVKREHLAVAVNGTYFATASGSRLRFSGDFARSMQPEQNAVDLKPMLALARRSLWPVVVARPS